MSGFVESAGIEKNSNKMELTKEEILIKKIEQLEKENENLKAILNRAREQDRAVQKVVNNLLKNSGIKMDFSFGEKGVN